MTATAEDLESGAPRGGASRIGLLAIVAAWAAVLARVLALADPGERVVYVAGLSAFLAIYLAVVLRPPRGAVLVHVALALESALAVVLLALDPERDFLTVLFVLQCYQAAVLFPARPRLAWVAALVALTGASLVLQLGLLRGLALALVPMAAGVVLSTYPVVSRELEAARAASERAVADLRAAQQRLQLYADQVDELAAVEERSRLARELQESVSATLSDVLSASAAARGLLDDPDEAAPQLERLQALAQQALTQMRQIITELRPTQT